MAASRLLPDGWDVVTLGCSGDAVARSPDGRHHAKASTDVVGLRAERDRTVWLAGTPVPGPVVVDFSDGDAGAVLVTTTLPGAPASEVSDVVLAAAAVGALLARLHSVDVTSCPFDRRLATTLGSVRAAVARGETQDGRLDAADHARAPASLLAELEAEAADLGEPEDDVVVCHGDASLPNLFLDPRTGEPTGVLDVGRLGVADRHLDLALVLRSMRDPRNPQYGPTHEPGFWAGYDRGSSISVDERRLALHRRLDELL